MALFILFAVVFLVSAAVGVVLSLVPGIPAWVVVAAQVAAGVTAAALL